MPNTATVIKSILSKYFPESPENPIERNSISDDSLIMTCLRIFIFILWIVFSDHQIAYNGKSFGRDKGFFTYWWDREMPIMKIYHSFMNGDI